MYVHGFAEVVNDPLGTLAAGLFFIRIAPLAVQQLLVVNGHASATNPIFTVAGVNVVEIGHRGSPRMGCSQNIRSVAAARTGLID
jgi:hypothetical protein